MLIDSIINNSFEVGNSTEIIQNIINNLIHKFNMTELDSGKDKKITDKNKVIILTSTENQKNKEDKNISMDLGPCEFMLKNDYNISYNDSLYILQIISEEEGMKIPKIEYEIYYPFTDSNLTKLNLASCEDTKIEISISVKISGSLDKYNPKSDYYNDICSTTTSDDGTDITLEDRKNEFIDNNMSLCKENCDLIEYNHEKEKVKCSCNFFIVGTMIILYFLNLLIFSICSYDKIKKEIHNIIFALKINSNPIKKNKIIKIEKKNKKDKNYIKNDDKNYEGNINKYLNIRNKIKSKKGNYNNNITQNISDGSYNKINPTNKHIVIRNILNIIFH